GASPRRAGLFERTDRRTTERQWIRLLPPDFVRPLVDYSGIRVSPRGDSSHRVGEPAARAGRRPSRARPPSPAHRGDAALGNLLARWRGRVALRAGGLDACRATRSHPAPDARYSGPRPFLRVRTERSARSSRAPCHHRRGCGGVSNLDCYAVTDSRHASTRDHLMTAIVEARDLTRTFPMPSGPVTALRNVSIQIPQGEYVAITGPPWCVT